MEDTRWHQPTCAWPQTVRSREIENFVVSVVPPLQAPSNLLSGCARLKTEIGVRKVVINGVQLGGKVVGLGLTFLAHQLSLSGVGVKMQGDGTKVIKELAVNGPAVKFIPHFSPNKTRALGINGIL